MSHYREVIIEIYVAKGEKSSNKIRARPLPNQGFDGWNVQCSTKMREKLGPGAQAKLQVKVVQKEGSRPNLYAHHDAAYEVVPK